jgi:hypothetical protein
MLIDRFQKTRPKYPMDFHGRTDNNARHITVEQFLLWHILTVRVIRGRGYDSSRAERLDCRKIAIDAMKLTMNVITNNTIPMANST